MDHLAAATGGFLPIIIILLQQDHAELRISGGQLTGYGQADHSRPDYYNIDFSVPIILRQWFQPPRDIYR